MFLHAGKKLLERYGMTETGMLLGNPYRCVPPDIAAAQGTQEHRVAGSGQRS